MSTTEEYLDGLLQATMEQEPDTDTEKTQSGISDAGNKVATDDNHMMSTDEIAALFAQMQGETKPTAEPDAAAAESKEESKEEPETESTPKPAESDVTEAEKEESVEKGEVTEEPAEEATEELAEEVTEEAAEGPTEVSQPEHREETSNEENIATPAEDNHKMTPDEIAALFAQMQGESEPEVEPEAESENGIEEDEPTEKIEDMLPADTEVQPEESGMSDELAALLKEVQAEPDNEEQSEPEEKQQPEVTSEEKQKPQEEMEIDLSDPDAMSILQDIREKEDPKEEKKEDDPVNEIEELLRKSDNHEMVDDQMDLPEEQDEVPQSPAGESALKQPDQDETGDVSKPDKKKKGLFSLFGKKKKKQEENGQTDGEVSDTETTADESKAGGEESEPVADGEVHDLLQDLFGEEGASAEDFLQKEETADEQMTEAADTPKEKKESFWKKLGNALFEEDEEEKDQEEQEKEKKKKDKKGKKKKKVTDASDNQGILDELDAEGADGKKGKKKIKDKKKPKKDKKAQSKGGTEKEEDSKKLPVKMVIRIFVLAFSILALLLIVLEIIPSVWTAADARNAFYKKEYRTAYEEMTGRKLSKQDQRLYEKAKLVASMQQRYDAYTSYTALQMPVEALDSLLSGYQFWQQEADAIMEYDATTETDAVKYQILNTLYDTYQLTEDDVKQINALDDYDYTAKLEELTGSLSRKNSNAQQTENTAVTESAVDADQSAPATESPDNETQTDSAGSKADMTQMQDVLPEEEIE